eukprot:Opistho-2@36214
MVFVTKATMSEPAPRPAGATTTATATAPNSAPKQAASTQPPANIDTLIASIDNTLRTICTGVSEGVWINSAYAGPPTMTDHLEETLAHCQALYEAASLARTAAAMRSSADDRLSRIASGATTASEREEMYALYAAQCERRVDGARALHCELSGFVGSLRANGR